MNQIIDKIKDTKLFEEFKKWYYVKEVIVWDNNAFAEEKDVIFFPEFSLERAKRMDSFIHLDFIFQKGVFEEFLVQKGYWVQWSKKLHKNGDLLEMSFINEDNNCAYADDFEHTFEEHLIRTFTECNTH